MNGRVFLHVTPALSIVVTHMFWQTAVLKRIKLVLVIN